MMQQLSDPGIQQPQSLPPEVEGIRTIYAHLKQLCLSENMLVRDASVLMLALAHDVLRNIDVEHPPEHPVAYE
jgi:hypothetical protein